MKFKKGFLILMILMVSILFLPYRVSAEGTKEMYNWNATGNNDRLFFYYSTMKESGVDDLLKVHVYAKAGEKIKFATSGNGALMHLPSGSTQSISVTRTNGSAGFIYNANQEKDKSYSYKIIEATETGVYTFDMTNQSKVSSGSQYPSITSINSGTTAFANMSYGNSYIAAWDIQVANGSDNINGRVWLDYVSVYRGYSSYYNYSRSNIKFHVLTSDGYKYKVTLSSFDPGGMLFFISTRGIITKSTNEILYKSVYQSQVPSTYLMPIPINEETEFDSYGKIFFNEPADDLPNDISKDKLNANITEELTYNDGQEVGTARLAGIFKFKVSEPSTYTITIKNRENNQLVRTISNTAVEGENTVIWDGKSDNGSYVAAGNYSAEVNVRNGEYHFILADVETLEGGLSIQSEENGSKLYYDNSSLGGTSVAANGTDSIATPFKYSSNFGDTRLINTWTYASSQSSIDLIVLEPADNSKCVISGRVFKDNDRSAEFNSLYDVPMSGVKVYAEDANGNRYNATTVTNGEFAIIVPKGVNYTIGVDSDYRNEYMGSYVNTTNNETQNRYISDSYNVGNIGYYSALKKITVKKEWDDNDNEALKRTESINVNIKHGDTTIETLQLKANSGWTKSVFLPEKDSTGNIINYSVEEEEVSRFYKNSNAIIKVNNGVYTITNKYEIPNDKVDINIVKKWDDDDNQAGKRPSKINIKLFANDEAKEYELNDDNGWKITLDDMSIYDSNGDEISYRVEEEDTGSIFYQLESIDNDKYDFTINNRFVVPDTTINVKITKKWDDIDNQDGIRPSKLKMKLIGNNGFADEYELNEDEEWTHVFLNLRKYDSKGDEIEYSISEDDTDEYTIIDTSIKDNDEEIELTSTSQHRRRLTKSRSSAGTNDNSDDNNSDDSSTDTSSDDSKDDIPAIPNTSDKLFIYIIIFVFSIIGLVSHKLFIKKSI